MLRSIVFTTLVMFSIPSYAEWTGGFSLGPSDTSGFCDQFNNVSCDRDTDLGYKFFVGKDFGDYFRVEGFWAYLGSARVEDQINVSDSATVNVGGVGVSAMGIYPVTPNLDLFTRVGVMQTMIGEHRLERVKFMYESTSVSPAYGAGLRYDLNEDWSVRAEWEHFDIEAKTELPIDLATVGLEFAF